MREVEVGKLVKVADEEFIVLDKFGFSVLCLAKDFAYKNTRFDSDTNNYAESEIRRKLNTEYLDKIVKSVGRLNIWDAEIDLTSDDGLDDYDRVTDSVGLLTADMYRKYSRIIERYPVNDWWWLATPWSTPHRNVHRTVRRVNGGGALLRGDCGVDNGVRPFCIFSTSIFES